MIGQRIGNYRVVRRLGQGGMGLVFEAVHEHIGRRAAIKVLRPRYSQDPDTALRLINEARAVNIVDHPGLVDVFESGQLPGGETYLVMEYLEGQPLSQRFKQGLLPLADAVRLFRQLASALSAAHARGIVHRDLKPDNVMIVADPDMPGGERVKILDFGIAKLDEDLGAQGPSATRTGVVLGTPAYMAPEQCRGLPVDEQADVYALGAMLYEALAGRPPFHAEGAFEIMAMHVFQPPPPLPPAEREGPALPEAVIDLVQAMLAKRPEDRPGTGEVADALQVLLQEGGSAAPGTSRRSERLLSLFRGVTADTGRSRIARSRGRRSALLVSAGLCLGAMVTLGAVRPGGRSAPEAPPGAALLGGSLHAGLLPRGAPLRDRAPRRSRVSFWVTSKPAGAQVLRADSGQVLGTTPWRHEQSGGDGRLGVLLRLPGFFDKRLDLDLSDDDIRQETLDPVLLYGVWGAGPGEVFATGNEGTLLRWDGRGWTRLQTGTRRWLYGVWGAGPREVWAVGSSGTVLRWDGQALSPVNSGTEHWLYGVWGHGVPGGAAVLFAVGGGGTVLRREGGTFAVVPSGTHHRLYGVWGAGADDVWIAGDGGTLLHFDGQALQAAPSGVSGWLYGVWGSGPTDVWAVGHAGCVLHYDGKKWNQIQSGTDRDLYGVWGAGPDDVWAVGERGALLHWDGRRFTRQQAGEQSLYAAWGEGAGRLWAVGYSGTVLVSGRGPAPAAAPGRRAGPGLPVMGWLPQPTLLAMASQDASAPAPAPPQSRATAPAPTSSTNKEGPGRSKPPRLDDGPPIHQEFSDEDVRIVE